MSTQNHTKLKLALIGTGGIAGAHVQGMLAHADKVECVALCDVSDANLARRAEQLGNEPARYHDWDTLLAEQQSLDAVIIALPHQLHAPAILAAAAAGKHILCEKPMCMTLKEADTILDAVARSGVTYMSAHNQLFTPVVQEAKRLLDEGTIGQLRWLRTQDCFVAGATSMRGTWRGSVASQGGGELIDTGYHPSYLLLYLAGAGVAEVRASMSRFHMQIEGEDTASVQVRFQNGVLGELLTSWAMPLPYGSHQIHLLGDEGELFGSGRELFYRPTGFAEPARRLLPAVESTFSEEIGHFADCLQSGSRPLHGAEEGRAVLKLILRATESAAGWQETAPRQLAPVVQG
jgi:predicted dehydrogenase